MPAPPPPAASASWSACMSSRGRPTTSRRFSRSRSGSHRAQPARWRLAPPLARRHWPQRQALAHHQERLRRVVQVEQPPVQRTRKDLIAAHEERHRAAVADGFVEPDAKDVTQRVEEMAQLRNGKSAPAQIGERLELEDVERRIPPLRI